MTFGAKFEKWKLLAQITDGTKGTYKRGANNQEERTEAGGDTAQSK